MPGHASVIASGHRERPWGQQREHQLQSPARPASDLSRADVGQRQPTRIPVSSPVTWRERATGQKHHEDDME